MDRETASSAVVRRVAVDEVDLYRDIRLAALRDAPEAFGEPLAQAEARSLSEYAERVSRGAEGPDTLNAVAVVDGEAVGLVGGHRSDAPGIASLVSMWVAPDARGSGIAERLVEFVADWATANGYTAIELCVTRGNAAAQKLYTRCGFQPTGHTAALRSHPELTTETLRRLLTV